jgi:Uma2 family endonuclease
MEGTAQNIGSTRVTAEQLLARSAELGRCELIDGEIHRMSPAGAYHGNIVLEISGHLHAYLQKNELGALFGAETGFIVRRNLDTVRAPDVMFLSAARIPDGGIPDGYLPVAPDLAVEIISPNDTFPEVSAKAEEYLAAGVKIVWVVEPRAKRAYIFRPGRDISRAGESDALSGEDVLPGFSLPLGRLFERK